MATPNVQFVITIILVSLLPGLTGCSSVPASGQSAKPAKYNGKLRLELCKMADHETRSQMMNLIPITDSEMKNQAREMIEGIEHHNRERFREIIEKYGWPTTSMVGEDGATAAMNLARSDTDLVFMRRCLDLMRAAVEKQQLPASHFAQLFDRIRVLQHQPQYYGTQWVNSSDGKLVPATIEDEANLEQRRAAVGLPTFKSQQEGLQRLEKQQEKTTPKP